MRTFLIAGAGFYIPVVFSPAQSTASKHWSYMIIVYWMCIYLFTSEGLISEKIWTYGKVVVCGHSHVLPSSGKQAVCQVSIILISL